LKQRLLAKCADCMNLYADGRLDCGIEECSLYPLMPYQTRVVLEPKQRNLSLLEKMRERGRQLARARLTKNKSSVEDSK